MIEKCPYCKKEYERTANFKARSQFCPHCNKRILYTVTGKNLTPDKNGILRKKYRPKK